MERAVRIGITGKLGSGKSTLMHALATYGVKVINTDDLAKSLMVTDAQVRSSIEKIAGKEVYVDGQLDRQTLASKLFQNEKLRHELEAVVHPAVTREIEKEFHAAPAHSLVAVESALMLTSNFKEHFDYIILVDATDAAVLERVEQFSSISREDAARRLGIQNYANANYEDVDITIENTGSPEVFMERVVTLMQMLSALAQRDLPERPLHAV